MLQAPVLCPSAPDWMGFGREFCRQDAANSLPKKQHPPAGLCLEPGRGRMVPAHPKVLLPAQGGQQVSPCKGPPPKPNPANFSLKLERLLRVPRLCSIPITATFPHWPPHGCHPQSCRTLWLGTVVAPGDASSVAAPCASSTVHGPHPCPVPSAVRAGGGELEWLGREVWEPCRNAGLGAGACQAQMGSLVVVKIIQPLLKTQAQQSDPTAPVVAIPTRALSVFASPAVTIHPWDLWPQLPITCHMFPTPGPLCSARMRGLSFFLPQGRAP